MSGTVWKKNLSFDTNSFYNSVLNLFFIFDICDESTLHVTPLNVGYKLWFISLVECICRETVIQLILRFQ